MSLQEADGVGALGWVRRRIFGISPEEPSFERRGFVPGRPEARRRLESIGGVFLQGYHAALEEEEFAGLARRLDRTPAEARGFAYEGAAMGLSLLDLLTPWNSGRWGAFLRGHAGAHIYMQHVGLGWAFARLRRNIQAYLVRLDPLLCWLAVDGYGFHEGYFHSRRYTREGAAPKGLSGYALRAFDQGLGRSIWFSSGADVQRVAAVISALPEGRRADLWSGVGLACTYAGSTDRAGVETLCSAAAGHRAELAQGAAFAAKTRQRAGNPAPHTERACRIICGTSADEAAEVTDIHLKGLSDEGSTPAFECWRRRIRSSFATEVVSP